MIRPKVCSSSPSFREMRIHSTSIGAEAFSNSSSDFARTVEWRPSAPITRSAPHFGRALRCFSADSHDAPVLRDQVGRLRVQMQLETGISPRLLRDKIEKIPLRHQRQELAGGRQMGTIGHRPIGAADLRADMSQPLVRQPQKFIQQPQFPHQFQRGGMDGVTAEIAQKIAVLFQHRDRDPPPAPATDRASSPPGRPRRRNILFSA